MLSPPLGKLVIGTGRLQFNSAQNLACRMRGVFVIPNDSLVAYVKTSDSAWTSGMYMGKDGAPSAEGWVLSSRLKTTVTMGNTEQ